MKCRIISIMQHFIWVHTVCVSTPLEVSSLQRINSYMEELKYLNYGKRLYLGPNFGSAGYISMDIQSTRLLPMTGRTAQMG